MDYIDSENRYSFNVYTKKEIVLVRGKGAKVWDDQGREYIDCVSGHGVANIGHCNDQVVEAITRQAKQLITCSNIFYNDVRARLFNRLIGITPDNLKTAFLCNSGAESIETAIKFARFTTKKTEFITAMRGFHGRTMGALSATYTPKYREDFEPIVPGFNYVPFNNFKKLKEKVNENTAAVLLEVVQGEGGVHVGKQEYLREVQKLCNEEGILFIIDEVQSGFCRTGKMFALEHFGIEADMMCVAKAIAGGVPMGAVLCSEKIEVPVGKHGNTFGGNPLACAASLAAIDYMMQEQLDRQAKEKGEYFLSELKKVPLNKVREIRGIGLMIGLELKEKVQPYLEKLIENGILALPAGQTVLRILPPVTIEYDELDFVLDKIMNVLR